MIGLRWFCQERYGELHIFIGLCASFVSTPAVRWVQVTCWTMEDHPTQTVLVDKQSTEVNVILKSYT